MLKKTYFIIMLGLINFAVIVGGAILRGRFNILAFTWSVLAIAILFILNKSLCQKRVQTTRGVYTEIHNKIRYRIAIAFLIAVYGFATVLSVIVI